MYAITACPIHPDGTLGNSFNIAVHRDEQAAVRDMRQREKLWPLWSLNVVPCRHVDDDDGDDGQPDEAHEWASFDPRC